MLEEAHFTETTVMATLPGTTRDHMPTDDLRAEEEASLVLLTGARAGTRVALGDSILIGRGAHCDLHVPEADISREHARVTRTPEGYVVEDLGSRNGTHVDGAKVGREILRVGQRIKFGKEAEVLFTVVLDVQDQLLHKQKLEALGRLAGGIAHDFNNLLGAVLSNVSFLMEDYSSLPEDEVRSTLEDVQSAAIRAAELTRQLLGFARKGKYETVPTSLDELTHDVVKILGRTIDPGIVVDIRGETDLWVLGDRSQLHQVLLNLSINARDAMPRGGTLTLELSREGNDAVIQVTDTGTGMPDDVMAHAFEPFFTTKEVGHGTGLGLATAYGVVKNHGGEITVESEVGVGTTFRITLPRHVPAENADASTTTSPGTITRGTILVVDDEDLHRRGCARVLRRSGYEVVTARDGAEAIELYDARGDEFDVILLDLRMPNMTGDEVARRIRIRDPNVRIIAMSGYVDARRADSLLQGMASSFLRKPYTTGALEDAVQRAMSASVLRAG